MKNLFIFLIILLSFLLTLNDNLTLDPSESIYYQEKYFRFLANNYENIKQGDYWTIFHEEKGIGFKASKDFGSFLFVKDWSIYSFKLTKIIFRPFCSYNTKINGETIDYDAELLLYHSIDNNYFPPGKRVYLGINYLIISVPFKITNDNNPSIDKLFEFLNLRVYSENTGIKVGPKKPIKLYQMIQHQPQYLFESEDSISKEKTLYLIFSQYHHISVSDYNILKNLCDGNFGQNYFINQFEPDSKIIYRNFQNPDDLKSKLTLMAYNNQQYFKLKWIFLIIIYFILV